jgi:predicted transcriptional regulator YheO
MFKKDRGFDPNEEVKRRDKRFWRERKKTLGKGSRVDSMSTVLEQEDQEMYLFLCLEQDTLFVGSSSPIFLEMTMKESRVESKRS